MRPLPVAVIDVGKTNAKLALVDVDNLCELSVITRASTVINDAHWPHFDLDGLWLFFLHNLKELHSKYGIDAISVTTHGASCVLIDKTDQLVAPILDYEFESIESCSESYDKIRPDFEETGSPRLRFGLNLGAQIHWQFETQSEVRKRTHKILTYPQYWGWRLTGEMASDATSLGCHTDLWNPWLRTFSSLANRLGIAEKIAQPRLPNEILGNVLPEIARQTGLNTNTPVVSGIHDSNASLYPYLISNSSPLNVISSGTWVVAMAVGSNATELDATRDVLVNVNGHGLPVPSARFMGGREFDLISPTNGLLPSPFHREATIVNEVMLLPSVVTSSGPFRGKQFNWDNEPTNDGERIVALSLYLALMTYECLQLVDSKGPIIVEGPFTKNRNYLEMLASLSKSEVSVTSSITGTSIGAALLFADSPPNIKTDTVIVPKDQNKLLDYAARWRKII